MTERALKHRSAGSGNRPGPRAPLRASRRAWTHHTNRPATSRPAYRLPREAAGGGRRLSRLLLRRMAPKRLRPPDEPPRGRSDAASPTFARWRAPCCRSCPMARPQAAYEPIVYRLPSFVRTRVTAAPRGSAWRLKRVTWLTTTRGLFETQPARGYPRERGWSWGKGRSLR